MDVGDIFVPLVPVMGVAIVALLALAFALGLKERRRLGVLSLPDGATLHAGYDEDGPRTCPRSRSTRTCAARACCGSTPA